MNGWTHGAQWAKVHYVSKNIMRSGSSLPLRNKSNIMRPCVLSPNPLHEGYFVAYSTHPGQYTRKLVNRLLINGFMVKDALVVSCKNRGQLQTKLVRCTDAKWTIVAYIDRWMDGNECIWVCHGK